MPDWSASGGRPVTRPFPQRREARSPLAEPRPTSPFTPPFRSFQDCFHRPSTDTKPPSPPLPAETRRRGNTARRSECDQGAHRRHRPHLPPDQPFPSRHVAGTRRVSRHRSRRLFPHIRRRGRSCAGLLHVLRDPRSLPRVGAEERRALRRVGRTHGATAPPARPLRGLRSPVGRPPLTARLTFEHVFG